jgi:acetoacetyl-CoA synthetase
VIGIPGELVVTTPMPSMPVGLAGDPDGRRLRAAYYDQNPGVWTHGDWICIYDDGASVISGRSDSTLNRGGVRLGTSDFYSVAEDIPGITDSLVVHLEDPAGGAGRLILFVVGPPTGDEERVRAEVRRRLRSELSPRHVPDDVVVLPALPRTLSGKKLETPVKRILQGAPVDSVVSRDSLVSPDALDAIARWHALEGEDS